MPNPAEEFFEGIITDEMRMLNFESPLVRMYLVGLLCSFVQPGHGGVFHVRKDPAVATHVFEADLRKVMVLGDKLLFGTGIFPEHFVASGKRTVSLSYYLNILEKVIARRLAAKVLVWSEIESNFSSTMHALYGVRRRVKFGQPRSEMILKVFEETGEIL
jgi:hypothetical protein